MPIYIPFLATAAILCLVLLLRKSRRDRAKALAELVAKAFIVKPYLQLGNAPTQSSRESVEVHWISDLHLTGWKLEYRPLSSSDAAWLAASAPQSFSAGNMGDGTTATRWQSTIASLEAGSKFEYRVSLREQVVFTAVGKCRMPAGKPFRAVIYGDIANGSPGSRQTAYQVWLAAPDVVILAGDLAYNHGLMREYMQRFFPVMNSDTAGEDVGAPIMRSCLVIADPGNHDEGIKEVGELGDLRKADDLGAFYVLWSQPLNGPLGREATQNVPRFLGGAELMRPLLTAAGERFPRMSNFSFDFGDSHWLMLDANWYMDWSNPALRAWVDEDLRASDQRWKFVVFHQPPFSTDVKHADEQRMRLLADIFEKHGVAVVFGGHNHAYERTHPLRFTVTPRADGKPTDDRGRVAGTFVFDRKWDGKTVTKMDGVLYIVTGAGGARMYLEAGRRADHSNLPPYTAKLIDDVHSFTVLDLTFDRLTFRQVSLDGRELDRFEITQ